MTGTNIWFSWEGRAEILLILHRIEQNVWRGEQREKETMPVALRTYRTAKRAVACCVSYGEVLSR